MNAESLPSSIAEMPVGTLFDEEELSAIRRVLTSGETLSRGADIGLFEQEFAAFCQAPYAVAMNSCTAALRIAVQILRLRAGDEVVVPANAFWNTVASLVERGVTLKVADIDPSTLTIDPASVRSLVSPRTRAIVLLSLGGIPCDMDQLRAIADEHKISLIEDAAHSIGSVYRGHSAGSLADISCFSFATLKNISTLGEGGMLVTRHEAHAQEAKKLRETWPIGRAHPVDRTHMGAYPRPAEYGSFRAGDAYSAEWEALEEVGTNYKMTTPAAAVGRVQLKKLPSLNARRAAIASAYDALVERLPGTSLVRCPPNCHTSHHLYNFRIDPARISRDALVQLLKERYNVHLILRFWPIHLHNALRLQGHGPGEAPVYERVWFTELMSLPIAPGMSDAVVQDLCARVEDAHRSLCR